MKGQTPSLSMSGTLWCLLPIQNLPSIFLSSVFTSTVEEDESAMPKKDSRLLLAKFNDQMEKLYELLRAVEDIRLAPEVRRQYAIMHIIDNIRVKFNACNFLPQVLEPDPVDLASVGLGGGDAGKGKGPNNGNPDDARWSGEARYGNVLLLHSFACPYYFLLDHLDLVFSSHLAAGQEGLRILTRVSISTLGLPPPRFLNFTIEYLRLTHCEGC